MHFEILARFFLCNWSLYIYASVDLGAQASRLRKATESMTFVKRRDGRCTTWQALRKYVAWMIYVAFRRRDACAPMSKNDILNLQKGLNQSAFSRCRRYVSANGRDACAPMSKNDHKPLYHKALPLCSVLGCYASAFQSGRAR